MIKYILPEFKSTTSVDHSKILINEKYSEYVTGYAWHVKNSSQHYRCLKCSYMIDSRDIENFQKETVLKYLNTVHPEHPCEAR